jgi:CrcB protein
LRSLAVIVGGAIGSLARWTVGNWIGSSPGAFPTATFVVNVSGAFGLGVAGVLLIEIMAPTRYLRTLITIGFFGAYTTFSTMALEGVRLLDIGHESVALSYWIASFLVGQSAAIAGMWLGRSIGRSRREVAG